MGNYSNIKTSIQNAVYENNVGAVTGSTMQEVLTAIVNSVGLNSNFMGILSAGNKPTTTVDGKQFYIGCNESDTPLSIDLSGVNLDTVTITDKNLYIVWSDASGWQKKDIAAGLSSTIPTTVAQLSDSSNYALNSAVVIETGDVTISALSANTVYHISECSTLTVQTYGYDPYNENEYAQSPAKLIVSPSEPVDVDYTTLPSVRLRNGDSLHLDAGFDYVITVWGDLWSVEKYS